jgi:hypothetical protein
LSGRFCPQILPLFQGAEGKRVSASLSKIDGYIPNSSYETKRQCIRQISMIFRGNGR